MPFASPTKSPRDIARQCLVSSGNSSHGRRAPDGSGTGLNGMTEVSTNEQPPSRHIFLYELAKISLGTKVRFLGCVRDYDISQALLLVEHAYPVAGHAICTVKIDVSLVLETANHDVFVVGNWINVIGYVKVSASSARKRKHSSDIETKYTAEVVVQAVLLWTAGALRVGEYEKALERQKEARKTAIKVIAKYTDDGDASA